MDDVDEKRAFVKGEILHRHLIDKAIEIQVNGNEYISFLLSEMTMVFADNEFPLEEVESILKEYLVHYIDSAKLYKKIKAANNLQALMESGKIQNITKEPFPTT